MDRRTAKVSVYKQNVFAKLRKSYGNVNCGGGFSFAWYRTGDYERLAAFVGKGEGKVGSNGFLSFNNSERHLFSGGFSCGRLNVSIVFHNS